ncbi:hypothetical protein [Bdellovibrio bacteriovorus]|uniref:hypothetical protein n=1 Tax=Bdellovibrio bacteriovorus TaxID=959 RepID=UPI0035A82233
MSFDFKYRAILLCLFATISISCSEADTGSAPPDNHAPDDATPTTPAPNEPSTTPTPSPTLTPSPQPQPQPDPETPPVVEVPAIPSGDLSRENIGSKERVYNLFDRWSLKSSVTGGRGSKWADVTVSCHGKIDIPYALTAQQWQDRTQRGAYYRDVNKLIEDTGKKLLADHGNVLAGTERENFLRALKALSWQESNWQHYVRYKDWFFIFLSGGSYNVLDDWGISQVARSGFSANQLLNAAFFSSGKYCGIASTLYYGFTEYYDNYMEARSASCNQTGNPMDKLLGAYNRYSSGYSACYNGYSSDSEYRNYQIRAMNGLKGHYNNMPWVKLIGP